MSTQSQIRKFGRPRKKDGPLVVRPVGLPSDMNEQAQKMADEMDISLPELVRMLLNEKLQGKTNDLDRAAVGTNQARAPYLSSVPCGPWKEALGSASTFVISEDTADEIEFQEKDVWVRADGDSMEGAGISDGAMVLVRPSDNRPPKKKEIILVQAISDDDKWEGALKTFDGFDPVTRFPRLLNGDGTPYQWPAKTERYEIIGRAVAQMGRL